MTLQEAHQKLRLETIFLRRENDKLKQGTYVDADRLANEKEIRHLKWELSNATRERDNYHALWRKCITDGCGELKSEVLELRKLLREANDMIAKLKVQMNQDHENSSFASSQKPFRKKIKNSRVKTDRKAGGQPGHVGYKRPHMEPTNPIIILPVPDSIQNNSDLYPTTEYISKQVADLKISVDVTEYRAQVFRSHSTGQRFHAPFPNGISNEFNYGENAKALAFLLNNYCNVSIDKTSELISGISDGNITLSKGLINSLPLQFSSATEKERQHIFSMLLKAPSMHSDATPGKVNGKTVQVIVCANQDELLYFFREHKGHAGIQGTPAEHYQQILVHDHDITYYNYGADHQECLAHVSRYLQSSIENEPNLTWNSQMKKYLSNTIHEVKQNRILSEQRITELEDEYVRILWCADREYSLHPPNKYYPDGYNLYLRMKDLKHNHLLFLSHPEIEYTNNISERALRKFKRKFKQAVTFRCNDSVEALCNCMSVIETRRLQGCNVFNISKEIFSY